MTIQNWHLDWSLIGKAVEFYKRLGFFYVEVPWIVSDKAMNVTLPPTRVGIRCDDGLLVGSAEQSFIQLMLNNEIADGWYVAASPCFRDDPIDETHQRMFFKVELIRLSKKPFNNATCVQWMTEIAIAFFQSIPNGKDAKVVATEAGYDIELNGIELGSYGYRSFGDWNWVYGTGLAEPRFSFASARNK